DYYCMIWHNNVWVI
nr:immunoglobulin light chain junction region [Macaca mulatta]MOW69410.1 immunoglobulin light chain junction region [Macaca mulatta]